MLIISRSVLLLLHTTIVYTPLWRKFRTWTKEAIIANSRKYIFKTDDRRLHQVVVVLLDRRCLLFWKGKNNLLQITKRIPILFTNLVR